MNPAAVFCYIKARLLMWAHTVWSMITRARMKKKSVTAYREREMDGEMEIMKEKGRK